MARRSTARMLGNVSLSMMIGGMVVMEGLIHFQLLANPAWRILASGFEAGTIGGLADWYAVRAMFHHVPIPLLGRHSDILLRNRSRITDAIVDAVQNKWLSAEAIEQFLARQAPSKLVLDYLQTPEQQQQILAGVRSMLQTALSRVDAEPAKRLLEQVIRDQLLNIDIAEPLGRWLVGMIRQRNHHALWETLLLSLDKAISDPASEAFLADTLQKTAARYARAGVMKGLGKRILEATGMVDYPAMASATLAQVRDFVDQARQNPEHPLRRRLDQAILRWAMDLEQGKDPAAATVNAWRLRMAGELDLSKLMDQVAGRLTQTLHAQLATPDAHLARWIEQWLRDQLDELTADQARQAKMDQWVRTRVPQLVARYSHLIGDVVRGKLAGAADAQWISDIENNVGDDLQYIRLNGAVVGFGVGVILATTRLMLWLWAPGW